MTGLVEWWVGAEPDHNRKGRHRLLLISLALICIATFALGVPRLHIYGHDVFFLLDGAWRVCNGQRPAVDFYGVLGPVWFLLYGGALAVAHYDAIALCYGSTFVAVLVATWAFLMLRRRMEPAPCFVACLSLVLLAVSPYPIGMYPTFTSFSMNYNRYGYALAGLVLLECFLQTYPEDGFGKQFTGGFSSGLACAIMLFLKISFGLVGLVLVLASIVLRSGERPRSVGLITGFALFALPILAYLRFDLGPMVREFHYLSTAQGSLVNLRVVLLIAQIERFELLPVLLLTVLVAVCFVGQKSRRIALLTAGLLASGGDMLLNLTNTQRSSLPLMPVLALLLVNEITSAHAHQSGYAPGPDRLGSLSLLCFGLLAAGIPLAMDAAGLVYALADKVNPEAPSYSLPEAHLRALQFVNYNETFSESYDNGERFVGYTAEGMALVAAHSGKDESVRSLTNANPFSYAMLRPPSEGGAIDIGDRTISGNEMPPLMSILGNVDLILIPRFEGIELSKAAKLTLSTYHDVIANQYATEAESPHWVLLRKRALHGP